MYYVNGVIQFPMRRLFTLLLFSILISGCIDQKDPIQSGTQLLLNPDLSSSLESVSPWVAVASPGFRLGVSEEVFRSGNRSIFIENDDLFNENSGTWQQTYSGVVPRTGRTVRLRAYLKGEDIRLFGPASNIFISLRMLPVSDNAGNLGGRFISTQNRVRVEGTFDWRPIEVVMNNTPPDVQSIAVFLVMGQRVTGRVYFDDITLTVE